MVPCGNLPLVQPLFSGSRRFGGGQASIAHDACDEIIQPVSGMGCRGLIKKVEFSKLRELVGKILRKANLRGKAIDNSCEFSKAHKSELSHCVGKRGGITQDHSGSQEIFDLKRKNPTKDGN